MRKILFLFILALLLGGCGEKQPQAWAGPAQTEPETTQAPEPRIPVVSAWYAYWDYEKNLPEGLEEVSLFAACYAPDGSLFFPENLGEIAELTADFPGTRYLCFVNDEMGENPVPKSLPLLEILLSEGNREKTASDMISAARDGGFNGIDLDFEQVRKAPELIEPYLAFIEKLYEKTCEAGLALRVVLEPGWDAEKHPLPAGPVYTLMCYNLYGSHSGPGPKADHQFLRKMAGRFAGVENLHFALATGGFDWGESRITALTTDQAEALCREREQEPRRDADSGALVFTYEGEDGSHEVWFADGQTLALWAQTLQARIEENVHIDLWRAETSSAEDVFDQLVTELRQYP